MEKLKSASSSTKNGSTEVNMNKTMKTQPKHILKRLILVKLIMFALSFSAMSQNNYDKEGFAIPGSIKGARYGLGEDSVTCVTQLSLYRENYRQWRSSNFQNEAINYTVDSWRFVLLNCPLASQNTYIDGSKIIEHLYNKATTPELKQAYIDTLMFMYDRRIMAFGNEGFILGRKAAELLNYQTESYEEAFKILTRAVDRAGKESESAVVFYYFMTTVRMVRDNGLDSINIFDNYDIAMSVIDFNIKALKAEIENNPAEAEKNDRLLKGYESALGNIENLFEPFATCDNLQNIYSKKFLENPNDTAMIEKMLSSFERKNCTPPLYYEASEQLYKLKPTASSAFALGRMYYRLEQFNKAIPFLQDAVNGLQDNDAKADAYYLLADVYRNLKNYTASRANALKTTELRPGDGKPWILIGDLYAISASTCGDNEVTSKAAYWAAVDKYQRARSVDESVASLANSRIATYSAAFPKGEQLFFRGYNKGDSFRVECWINETTTIRSSD
jgi:tetratricopeptide (TPR) repeat protein